MDVIPQFHSEVYYSTWHLAEEFVSSSPPKVDSNFSRFSSITTTGSAEDNCLDLAVEDLPALCRTKDGSIKVQQFLASSSPEQIDSAIPVFAGSFQELTRDSFANYAVQSLLQACSAVQRLALLSPASSDFIEISCHPKGTHAIQAAVILCCSKEEESFYYSLFKGRVLELSKHEYASHVIHKLLGVVKDRHLYISELLGSLTGLAAHKMGLSIVKKVLNNPEVSNELLADLLSLMQDPYGNYVVQTLIETLKDEVSFAVISTVRSRVAQLSIQKYSSNVIELCLKEESMRTPIIEELLTSSKIPMLMSTHYGCFVLKSIAEVANPPTQRRLKAQITEGSGLVSQKSFRKRWTEILSILQ